MSRVSGKPARTNSSETTAVANGSLSTSTPLQSKMTTKSLQRPPALQAGPHKCGRISKGEDSDAAMTRKACTGRTGTLFTCETPRGGETVEKRRAAACKQLN